MHWAFKNITTHPTQYTAVRRSRSLAVDSLVRTLTYANPPPKKKQKTRGLAVLIQYRSVTGTYTHTDGQTHDDGMYRA